MAKGDAQPDGKRGPLKQARLGAVQKKVLVILLGMQMQRQRAGEPFTGLPYREIQARLYHQAILGDGQWLQTVHAQLLAEQGQLAESNLRLLEGIELVTGLMGHEVRRNLLPDHPLTVDMRLMLTEQEQEIVRLQNLAFLLRHAPEGSDLSATHVTLLSLARQAGLLAAPGSYAFHMGNGFLTLTEEEKASAEKTVLVQHASLSRALRLLETHRLIEPQEVMFNHLGDTERRYFITEAGVQRLSQEGEKIKGRR